VVELSNLKSANPASAAPGVLRRPQPRARAPQPLGQNRGEPQSDNNNFFSHRFVTVIAFLPAPVPFLPAPVPVAVVVFVYRFRRLHRFQSAEQGDAVRDAQRRHRAQRALRAADCTPRRRLRTRKTTRVSRVNTCQVLASLRTRKSMVVALDGCPKNVMDGEKKVTWARGKAEVCGACKSLIISSTHPVGDGFTGELGDDVQRELAAAALNNHFHGRWKAAPSEGRHRRTGFVNILSQRRRAIRRGIRRGTRRDTLRTLRGCHVAPRHAVQHRVHQVVPHEMIARRCLRHLSYGVVRSLLFYDGLRNMFQPPSLILLPSVAISVTGAVGDVHTHTRTHARTYVRTRRRWIIVARVGVPPLALLLGDGELCDQDGEKIAPSVRCFSVIFKICVFCGLGLSHSRSNRRVGGVAFTLEAADDGRGVLIQRVDITRERARAAKEVTSAQGVVAS
jgi:hypothetical protein